MRHWKLVVVVVSAQDVKVLLDALNHQGFAATLIQSQGGFLREGNATVFIGVEDARLAELRSLLWKTCRTRTTVPMQAPRELGLEEEPSDYLAEIEIGGAVVFVLPVERYLRL